MNQSQEAERGNRSPSTDAQMKHQQDIVKKKVGFWVLKALCWCFHTVKSDNEVSIYLTHSNGRKKFEKVPTSRFIICGNR